jgi:hypothetical protein
VILITFIGLFITLFFGFIAIKKGFIIWKLCCGVLALLLLFVFLVYYRGWTAGHIHSFLKTNGVTAANRDDITLSAAEQRQSPMTFAYRADNGNARYFHTSDSLEGAAEEIPWDDTEIVFYEVTLRTNLLLNFKEIYIARSGWGLQQSAYVPEFWIRIKNTFANEDSGVARLSRGPWRVQIAGMPDKYIYVDRDGVYRVFYPLEEIEQTYIDGSYTPIK